MRTLSKDCIEAHELILADLLSGNQQVPLPSWVLAVEMLAVEPEYGPADFINVESPSGRIHCQEV